MIVVSILSMRNSDEITTGKMHPTLFEIRFENFQKLKEKSISLKNVGIERILGIGIAAAHKWDKSRVRKTWKSIVTRPAFDENLILLKKWKTLTGPGASFLSLTHRICSTEPSQNYCDRHG